MKLNNLKLAKNLRGNKKFTRAIYELCGFCELANLKFKFNEGIWYVSLNKNEEIAKRRSAK